MTKNLSFRLVLGVEATVMDRGHVANCSAAAGSVNVLRANRLLSINARIVAGLCMLRACSVQRAGDHCVESG